MNARNIELVCPGDTIDRQNITATTCPGIPFVFALSNDTNRPEAKFDNISWKVGANYEPGEGKIKQGPGFVSQKGESADLRKQNYKESVDWYNGIIADTFG